MQMHTSMSTRSACIHTHTHVHPTNQYKTDLRTKLQSFIETCNKQVSLLVYFVYKRLEENLIHDGGHENHHNAGITSDGRSGGSRGSSASGVPACGVPACGVPASIASASGVPASIASASGVPASIA